ncbi:MAG: DUF4340 domain-containing protein [Bdellovibrionales bacterium]|nr:DUF4340 domain-containing protein [Bdellovibrionales bacterium]
MKSFRSTLIFAVIVAAVVGFTVYEMQRGESVAVREAKKDRLFPWNEIDVVELSVTRSDESFTLIRDGYNWKLKKPVEDRTDDFMVGSYISSILSQDGKVVEENNTNWKDYGLENATVQFEMVGKSNERRQIEVSSEKAYDGSFFIREGNRLLVGTSDWERIGQKAIGELRDKKFFHSDKKISGFRLRVPKDKIDLTIKREGEVWKADRQPDLPIAADEVDKFVLDSSNFKALDFVAEETEPKLLAHFGLDQPDLVLEYWLDGADGPGPHWWMKVKRAPAGKEGFAYHSERATIYKIHEDTVRRFSKNLSDFRDKKLPFKFVPDAVEKLSLKTSLTDLSLEKKDGKWTVTVPVAGKEVDQERVASLIQNLGELEARYFLGAKPGKGLQPPANRVVLKNSKGEALFELSWGASFKAKQELKVDSDEELYYAKTNLAAETLGVATAKIDGLPGQTLLKDLAKPEASAAGAGAAQPPNSQSTGKEAK